MTYMLKNSITTGCFPQCNFFLGDNVAKQIMGELLTIRPEVEESERRTMDKLRGMRDRIETRYSPPPRRLLAAPIVVERELI